LLRRRVGRRVARSASEGASTPEAPGREADNPSLALRASSARLRCHALTAADGTFADVSLEVRGGEVLGLYGLIGAGRSEWAQALFGLRRLAGGEIQLDGKTVKPHGPGQMAGHGLAYVPEDRLRQGLCRNLPRRANA